MTYYTADIQPLNGSNVTGNAVLILNSDANTLTVNISAFNLEPQADHLMHIHGLFDGSDNPIDSVSPTLADDTDGDGFIELAEGAAKYGPIILPLQTQNDALGLINYSEVFDLSDSGIFAQNFTASDLMPLAFREIVIHGKTVPTGAGAGTGGEVDGSGGYKTTLPVASGEIIVPEPGSLALLGLGGLMISRRRCRA